MATKAEQLYQKVEAMIASGTTKADAFKTLAEEYGQPVHSLRGSYYGYKRKLEGGDAGTASPRRTRRRETTPEDAVESAVATLKRSMDSIDAEIVAAEERANEAQAEYEALKASADDRKAAIQKKIDALSS